MFAASATMGRRRVFSRNLGNSQRNNGLSARPTRHETCRFCDAHDAQPERPDANRPDRDLHGRRRRVNGAFVTASALPLIAATRRNRHQSEPDVIEHAVIVT
jgi:hypothetical protein